MVNVELVKIHLKNLPPNPTKRTSCHALPYHLVGEAEELIKCLVGAGVIKEVSSPTQFCASSNFLRKPSG